MTDEHIGDITSRIVGDMAERRDAAQWEAMRERAEKAEQQRDALLAVLGAVGKLRTEGRMWCGACGASNWPAGPPLHYRDCALAAALRMCEEP